MEEPEEKSIGDKVVDMEVFLERLLHSTEGIYVENPLSLGTDFLKMGTIVVRNDVTKEDFMSAMSKMLDLSSGCLADVKSLI